jgi:hypothetical protein
MARPRPRPTTTARGLGHRHRQRRETMLRQHVEGSLCELCGEPMFRAQGLQADHEVPRAIAGPRALASRLVHSWCNARAGGILGAERNGRSHSGRSEADRSGLAMPWP